MPSLRPGRELSARISRRAVFSQRRISQRLDWNYSVNSGQGTAPAGGYLEVDLPEAFLLDTLEPNGDWVTWGRYRREFCSRLEDGAYCCAADGWSSLWIRCITRHEDRIEVVDGGGDRFTYRLTPLGD